ncbi:MAG: GDSL-type esterase/lipase family protein [Gammaproteobacteria bacterium]
MFRFKLAVCLMAICLLFLQACSDSVSLTPIPQDGVILAFGDSLTVGVGTSEAYSYPSVLAQLSGRKVVGAGVSGEETTQGLIRLPTVIDEVNPDLLILLEGGNDILRNKNLHNTKKNLAAMIELAHARGVQVVLIGVPEKKLFSDVAPLYEELAEQYGLVFADDLLAGLLRDNEYKSDAVHLNQRGYGVMAETIHELLVKQGAL